MSEEEPRGAFQSAQASYDDIMQQMSSSLGGCEVKRAGGAFTIAFEHASNALACAMAVRQAFVQDRAAEESGAVRVRMALDTREVKPRHGESTGWLLRRATGLLSAARGGQILCSEATAALLHGALGTDAHLTDMGFYRLQNMESAERVFAVECPGIAPDGGSAPRAPRAHISNLPLQFTSFFGREEELARLEETLLADEMRLITLTGLGGCGKTRLALEMARQSFETFRGAVWFVDLQDLSDPVRIADTVLDAMCLSRTHQTDPLDQVIAALSEQPSLLVLDNFEQLVEEGTQVAQALLERSPSLTCLVTSRQNLNLTGEHEFPVEPLPKPQRDNSPEDLLRCPSVELFVARAQAARPDFQVTRANAEAVAEICHRLDGIPLALELAAAWSQALSPARMLEQLEHRFDFLVTRKRGVPERHRTLRAAMDWSYRLLSPELQRLFARLSVFRGGWSVEAARTICEEPRSLHSLMQLQDCSLVRMEQGTEDEEETRFQMLDTLREFAGGQLTPEDRDGLGHRHAEYYLAFAEEAESHLQSEEQAAWLERLEKELENLRAALAWCTSADEDAELGRRLAGALWRFWHVRGYPSEGRGHFAELLKPRGTPGHTAAQAKALNAAGSLAAEQGDYAAARSLFEQSLAIQRALDSKEGIACSLNNLGLVAKTQGDHAGAHAFFEESLALHRELGDKRSVAVLLANQGNLATDLGDYAAARALYEEGLAIERELGSNWNIALPLNNLGNVARALGDYEAARSHCEEALAINREIGNRAWEAANLYNLGRVAACEGDHATAHALLREALTIWCELEERHGIACSLERLAEVANAQAAPERAARLLGAAAALRESIGAPLPPDERDEHDREIAATRATLGETNFAKAWAGGRKTTLDEAVACAMEMDCRREPKPGGPP